MMSSKTNLLKTIPFSELYMWDVKRYNSQNYSFKNAVFLKEILKPIKKSISKEELIKNGWKIINKINFQGKLFLRDETEIEKYKGNVFKVPDNSIIYSKINVRHGCIYYHEKNKIPFAVSSEYPVFTIDENKINGYYLILLLRSNEFKKLLNTKTSGISKARVKVDEFLNIKIPLPSLKEQNRIVENYNTKIELAKQQEEKAKELEQEIENYLFEVLGIEKLEEKKTKKGLQFVRFNDVYRWDAQFLIGNIQTLKSKYNWIKFSEIIIAFNKDNNGNSIRVNSINYPNEGFYYIGMENIEKNTGNLLELKIVKGKEIKSQTLRVPTDFILYGKLRPYLNKYWRNNTEYENIICSSEFFVFDINKDIGKQFFIYVLASNIIQNQITDKTSGARMPRINEEIFFNLKIPLPPLKIQQEIANHISELKQQIKKLQQQAKEKRELAIKEFETEIFN